MIRNFPGWDINKGGRSGSCRAEFHGAFLPLLALRVDVSALELSGEGETLIKCNRAGILRIAVIRGWHCNLQHAVYFRECKYCRGSSNNPKSDRVGFNLDFSITRRTRSVVTGSKRSNRLFPTVVPSVSRRHELRYQ